MTANAIAAITGETATSASSANARSIPCLTANRHSCGSVGFSDSTGTPPTWSSVARSLTTSNMRGTSETSTPSSWACLTSANSSLSGSEENATITCRASVRSIASARSSGVPSSGISGALDKSERVGGLESRNPTGRSP